MDEFLREALRLRKLGFAVHWLRPRSKIPVIDGWAAAALMTEQDLVSSYRRGYNLGFRPGKWSVVNGKEICVLDIDVRGGAKFADEAYAAAASVLGVPLMPNVISGSLIGRHQYLRVPIGKSPDKAAITLRQADKYATSDGRICPEGTERAKPAWVVEILSTGKQVVLPPSIHPDTGKPYVWTEGNET